MYKFIGLRKFNCISLLTRDYQGRIRDSRKILILSFTKIVCNGCELYVY